MTDNTKIKTVRKILRKHVVVNDVCACGACQRAVENSITGVWQCGLCGFNGPPVALACCCYDYSCSGGVHAGSGCPHGGIVCPVCDGGESDGWELVKEIRKILEDR